MTTEERGIVFACPDWETRIENRKVPLDLERYLPRMNQSRIDKAEQIFGRLRLPDVPGQPDGFTASGEWLFDLLRIVAGGLQPDGVCRRGSIVRPRCGHLCVRCLAPRTEY